jgi:tetratricopeptide (TPR) repeat protein
MEKSGVHFLMVIFWCTQAAGVFGCDGGRNDSDSAEQTWQLALQKWKQRDVDAFSAWTAVDEKTEQGRRARRLLKEADRRYQTGIDLMIRKDPTGALRAFNEGAEIAPIHPKHYLTLAKMYEANEMEERAAKYYAKFAAAMPNSQEAEAAREAARKVAPGLEQVFDPPSPLSKEARTPGSLTLAAVSFLLGFGILTILLLLRRRFSSGVSLARLIEQAPEMHSAVAYLVGSLRHELLKHRVGVAGDVIREIESGTTTGPQRAFLRERLFQGVPLDEAWQAHLNAFQRVLGSRFNPDRDRLFRSAGLAICRIQAQREALSSHSLSAIRALSDARHTLMLFDRRLAFLQSKLVRTRVDTELFEQIVAEIQGEYAAGAVLLDELHIEEVQEEVFIEAPRGDLVLILKNILRNAIMAVGRYDSDKKVGFGMRLAMEPTGQETVCISVWDSSPDFPSEEIMQSGGPDSGLGLVLLAVKRYGGVFEIIPAENPYKKEAIIRFFRAFQDADEPREEP